MYVLITVLFIMAGLKKTNAQSDGNQNAIIAAVPFLKIVPDARSSAMGDVGIAIDPDANTMFYNASNLVFAEYDFGLSLTYTSWLRALGLDDIFLGYLSTYKKIDDKQALGFGLRYFSVGRLQYTDDQGNSLQSVKPYELALDMAYARKLGKTLSLGLTLRYIMSNLGTGTTAGGATLKPAHAFATDLSLSYNKTLRIAKRRSVFRAGIALTNLGTKVSYVSSGAQEYLPANMGVGTSLKVEIDNRNSISFAADINKLLVPTPISSYIEDESGNTITNPAYDTNADGIADYKQQSMPLAVISSFGDAPGGVIEEINELMFSFGIEYWYNKQFAVRCGYYYEHQDKGNRQFFSVGVGVKYKIFNFNFSYLIPTRKAQVSPLDNTLRFSLMFNFGK
ncbi:type IX secretion system outer membrane channel protein PorV [Aureispira]|nr:type IX secretion system outer membrane channel protein PorV [Aureispira sp.]